MKTKVGSKEPDDRKERKSHSWELSKYGHKNEDWPQGRSKHYNQGKRKKKK